MRRKTNRIEKKHGVWFEEAVSAFSDTCARTFFDAPHSKKEDRFVLIGLSSAMRVLVVVHCYRDPLETVRIISARKATKIEEVYYVGNK